MSNITKLFVILVAIAAVVVSTMTIAFVSHSDYNRDKYNDLVKAKETAETNARVRGAELTNLENSQAVREANLKNQISQQQTQINLLQNSLRTAEEEKAKAQGDAAKKDSDLSRANATLELVLNSDKLKDDELKTLRDAKVMLDKQIKEVTARNIELDAQNQQQARLIRKQQEDIADVTRGGGAASGAGTASTAGTPAHPAPKELIAGKITRIENVGDRRLAQISVGAGDGVAQGMQFVVSRGHSQFLANLTITAVDERTSAGVLELVQGAGPQVGDDVFAGGH